MIKLIGLPLCIHPILFITGLITDRTGLHSFLLPLFIGCNSLIIFLLFVVNNGVGLKLYSTVTRTRMHACLFAEMAMMKTTASHLDGFALPAAGKGRVSHKFY